MLKEYLKPLLKSADTRKDLANRLELLYKARCEADYKSVFQPFRKDVDIARRDAGYIVTVIDELLPEI